MDKTFEDYTRDADAASKSGDALALATAIAAMRFIPKNQDDSGIESIGLWVNTDTGEPVEWLLDEGDDTKRVIVKKLVVGKKVNPDIFDPSEYIEKYGIVEKLY